MLSASAALRKDRTTTTKLQHRHFAEIARIIATAPLDIRSETAYHFAWKLAATNPNFDRHRFLAACGV